MKKIVLISCASKKLSHKARAKDLYVSPLFKMNLAFARSLQSDKIFILSAKYGLVDLEQIIAPYEQTLNTMPVRKIKKWADKVKEQMKGEIDFKNDEIIFLAGRKYRKFLQPIFKKVNVPLRGLSIGKQLQYLKDKTAGSKNICGELHRWANSLKRYKFPFNEKEIPLNGLYLLFEKGEYAHGTNRIVRVGTHTGQNQLRSRLKQHFLNENKDRSIFRKNIGRCILNEANDPFLKKWELDLTPKLSRDRHSPSIDFKKQKDIEQKVSKYIRENFSFVILLVANKNNRFKLESKIISTVSLCEQCCASGNWLGLFSPKEKIRNSGLWLVNELYKNPLSKEDFVNLKKFASKARP